MSRKDYTRAARIILMVSDVEIREYLAQEFASMFHADNPRFDRDRFYAAAGADGLVAR